MGSLSGIHTPVLLDRCVELLAPALGRPGAVVLDATLGMGGHSEALLERFPEAVLVGIDRDTDALRIAGRRLARFGDRARLVHAVYDEVDRALDEAGVDRLDGALFDLGVSSLQLDRDDRGFAYSRDAPLDMRMDQTRGRTAADVVAQATEGELRRLFSDYGDEPLAGRYARRIVETRESSPIRTSAQLVAVLQAATPRAVDRGHPGKRVFQALRIEVNAELDALEDALPAALDAVAVGGRIVVMSYQSLEDRLVKRAFQAAATSTTPPGLPVELPEHAARFRLLTRGAERASEAEQTRNPRSAPVRLRAAERVAAPVAASGRRAR